MNEEERRQEARRRNANNRKPMTEEERMLAERRRRRKIQEKRRRRKVMKQRLVMGMAGVLLLIIIAIVMSVRSCHRRAEEEKARAEAQKKAQAQEKINNTLHILAVGDNIYHDPILKEGKGEDDIGNWNYDFLYKHVAKDIKKADLAIVNQETPLVKSHENVSGYPTFGMPYEGGDALIKTGFDVVTQASNHAYDKGKQGIQETLGFWKDHKVKVLGIHEDPKESRVKYIKEKNFKIAMMNYTSLINENTKPSEENAYMVDVYDEEAVREDVAKAKKKADLVMVFLHTGKEDEAEVDEQSRKQIDFLAEQGVDIVIGTHPHVLRPYEMADRPDGGKMLVYYSLGNFISAQKEIPELLEGMADITIKKNPDTGKIKIAKYDMVPLVMHYEKDQTKAEVYKMEDYTEELAKSHGVHEYTQKKFTLKSARSYVKSILEPESKADKKAANKKTEKKKTKK